MYQLMIYWPGCDLLNHTSLTRLGYMKRAELTKAGFSCITLVNFDKKTLELIHVWLKIELLNHETVKLSCNVRFSDFLRQYTVFI